MEICRPDLEDLGARHVEGAGEQRQRREAARQRQDKGARDRQECDAKSDVDSCAAFLVDRMAGQPLLPNRAPQREVAGREREVAVELDDEFPRQVLDDSQAGVKGVHHPAAGGAMPAIP